MTKYFVAGNVWLIVALILILGKKNVSWLGCSFFGVGGEVNVATYGLMIFVSIVLSVTFFIMSRQKSDK